MSDMNLRETIIQLEQILTAKMPNRVISREPIAQSEIPTSDLNKGTVLIFSDSARFKDPDSLIEEYTHHIAIIGYVYDKDNNVEDAEILLFHEIQKALKDTCFSIISMAHDKERDADNGAIAIDITYEH